MPRPHRPLPLALLLVAVTAGSALAQTISSPYRHVETRQSVQPFGGYLLTDRGALELGPESGPIGGAAYTIRLGGGFNLQATVGYLHTTREVFDTTAVGEMPTRVGEADFGAVLADASLRFDVTGPRTFYGLMPYVLAGGGAAIETSGDAAAESELAGDARFEFGTRFAGHVGAGVEWFASRSLSLRAEARDVFWKLKTPPAFLRQNLAVPEDEWVQNLALTLGVAIHF